MSEQIVGYGDDVYQMLQTGQLSEVMIESSIDDKGLPVYERVPVRPKAPYHDEEFGHTLFEWEDESGKVRASFLLVPAGSASPKWRIKPEAGQANYLEYEVLLAGSGTFTCWGTGGEVMSTRLDQRQVVPERVIPMPLVIEPGDTFQVSADQVPNDGLVTFAGYSGGLLLGSFFRRGHFELEYEERVS